ncbi:MAG: hypothetical protein ACTHKH_18790 [Trinickia sp.]|jgi:hypothetical protein
MTIKRFYVRGHGGQSDQPLPPSTDIALQVITVGQFGSTMSDEVADAIIDGHCTYDDIDAAITQERIIYWTRAERDEWYRYRSPDRLHFTAPPLSRWDFDTLTINLTLEGDDELGECGLCYWDPNTSQLVWLQVLDDGEEMTLAEMADAIGDMLGPDDTAELYWAACMSADYWHGRHKKVSRNPLVL